MDVCSLFALLSITVLVISSWLVVRWARKRAKFAAMIDKIPHAKGHFLLGNAMEFMVSREELFETKMKFSRRFKDEVLFCFWLGPLDVLVELTRVEAVEVLLGSNNCIEKTKFYKYLNSWLGNGLLLNCGPEWRTRRKTLNPSFHFKVLDGFVEGFNKQAIIFASKMDPYADGNKSFDVYPLVSLCSLDIVCETTMQKGINSQDDGAPEYVNAINDTTNIIMDRFLKPWLSLDWVFRLTSMGKRFKENVAVMHDFTDKVIAKRRQEYHQSKQHVTLTEQVTKNDDFEEKKRLALLDTLLDCSENGQKLSMETIRSEVDTFMFAGHDTAACGITWTIFLLGHHHSIQDNVHKELYAIFGNSKRNLTTSDLNEMKYLECVIKESLRLYPPVPYYGRQIHEDMRIAGYDIPSGVSIMVNPYLLHRDPRYYPDPETFDPDRFLPENSSKRPLCAYIPFSAGPRNCIGQKFAIMEMKVVLAHMLRQFKVTSMEKREDLKLLSEVVLRPANGMWIKVEKR